MLSYTALDTVRKKKLEVITFTEKSTLKDKTMHTSLSRVSRKLHVKFSN